MSTTDGVSKPRSNTGAARRVSHFWKVLLAAVREWRERNKLRTASYDLSDTQLKGSGTTRDEIDCAASKAGSDPRVVSSAQWFRYLPTADGQIHPHSDKGP